MQISIDKDKPAMTSASCEKTSVCGGATEACYKPIFVQGMRCDPARRWVDCFQWKLKLGMVFDKELGAYILPEYREILLKRARQ